MVTTDHCATTTTHARHAHSSLLPAVLLPLVPASGTLSSVPEQPSQRVARSLAYATCSTTSPTFSSYLRLSRAPSTQQSRTRNRRRIGAETSALHQTVRALGAVYDELDTLLVRSTARAASRAPSHARRGTGRGHSDPRRTMRFITPTGWACSTWAHNHRENARNLRGLSPGLL